MGTISKIFSRPQQQHIILIVAGLVTLIELVNMLTGRSLVSFGILPRTMSGLSGIIFSPFIHGSFAHYLSNLLPLCVFVYLLSLSGTKRFFLVSFASILLTGGAVWLFAKEGYHVGASGIIYSYFGFLVVNGIVSKNVKQLFIALITLLFYGGLIFGVLPGKIGVSWESHLSGLAVGSLLGYWKK